MAAAVGVGVSAGINAGMDAVPSRYVSLSRGPRDKRVCVSLKR